MSTVSVYSTLCCALYTVQCTLHCTVHCTLYSALYTVQCTVELSVLSGQCTTYSVQYSVWLAESNQQLGVWIVVCEVYSVEW